MAGSKKPEQEAGRTFEESMARLEQIVSEMEAGTLGLEDLIARFEEGQKLIAFCGGKLNEVERKIEVLAKKDGELVAEPFDSEAQASVNPFEEAGEDTEQPAGDGGPEEGELF
jgi:exodeoxyribonuclease VII small subunit